MTADVRSDPQTMLTALERLQGTGVEFAGFLANHGPMAVDAMIRLGGAERVPDWIETYLPRLEPAGERRHPIIDGDWAAQVARLELVQDWTDYFERAIAEQGWRDVLSTWLPRLLPGAAASATHGLLRTAHAIRNSAEAGDTTTPLLDGEIAAGLAFWAARYQRLPGTPGLHGDRRLTEAIDRLPRLDPNAHTDAPGIGGRLDLLWSVDGLPDALDAWGSSIDPVATLDELIGQAARLLIDHPEPAIALCHAVTAPAAIRMILPVVSPDQQAIAVATCWQLVGAIVAAFLPAARGVPAELVDVDVPSVPALEAAALDHGDEHVIKLTEACIRQYHHTTDAQLLVAAEAFRPRIPPLW